jgi:hypothetical protein
MDPCCWKKANETPFPRTAAAHSIMALDYISKESLLSVISNILTFKDKHRTLAAHEQVTKEKQSYRTQ